MDKSVKCIQREHDLCDGDIIEIIDNSKTTRICECECHNSMYKLVRRMQSISKQLNKHVKVSSFIKQQRYFILG